MATIKLSDLPLTLYKANANGECPIDYYYYVFECDTPINPYQSNNVDASDLETLTFPLDDIAIGGYGYEVGEAHTDSVIGSVDVNLGDKGLKWTTEDGMYYSTYLRNDGVNSAYRSTTTYAINEGVIVNPFLGFYLHVPQYGSYDFRFLTLGYYYEGVDIEGSWQKTQPFKVPSANKVSSYSKSHNTFRIIGGDFTLAQIIPTSISSKYLNGDVIDSNNPYIGGDDSSDPGRGEFDYTGDEIPIPELPSISVCDSGFVSLYAPTESQLKSLSDFMWSDAFSIDSFKKLFNDPMECILGLSIVPVNIPTGAAREITVGNIVSTVSCDVVTNQFVSVDCGTLTISPTQFSGSYLDYAPYVKAYLYLPFIGVQPLNIDDIMNSTLHVVYHVDILTGACVCYVQATNRKTGGVSQPDAVLYTYMGQCSEPVPLSSQSYSGALSAIMQTAGIAGVAIGTVATGGASAPAAAAALTGLAGSTARTATSMKPSVQHGGSLMGSSGFMCTLYPYIIFDCPHTAIPTKQYAYTGFPSNKIVKLSSLSGFNVVQAVNLTVDGASGIEMEEIKNYLETGVII